MSPASKPRRALPAMRRAAVIAALFTAGGLPSAAIAQTVRYFATVPSVEELEAVLVPRHEAYGGAASAEGVSAGPIPRGPRPRGVEIIADGASAPTAPPIPSTAGSAAAMPIYFDLGSSRVSSSSLPYLERVAQVLRRNPGVRFSVQGHTDSTGDVSANAVLSWERAVGVYRVLVDRMRIDPNRLLPIGKGLSEPMPDTQPWDGRNRRVQFSPI